ncbi:MAG: cache domain-containing protein [Alphaproteobacteria bacterium]
MSLRLLAATFSVGLTLAVGQAAAESRATAPEAEAMVKKAVTFLRANGPEKAYATFTAKDAAFIDRDLYIIVYGLDGVVRAHGQNPKLVGKDLTEVQDVDGKFYVKERVELARSKGTFWQDYKFTNPLTKKIEPKTTYCERVEEVVVCGGVYKA